MEITVLNDNVAGGRFLAEHGLSYLIENNGTTILFDTGHSDVFLKNARELNINIEKDVPVIVLSHGHWDHGDGLRYLADKKLITHPGAFMKRFRKNGNTELGLDMTKSEVEQKFELITTAKPYAITDAVFFLGEVPRTNDFESKTTPFVDAEGNDDFVMDDSALAVVQNDALAIVTGCSHAGICNIIEHAKVITGIKKVDSVIGGFHLKYDNHQTKMTIEYFKDQQIKHIYPSHCTELPALAVFYHHFGIQQVKTGMQIEL